MMQGEGRTKLVKWGAAAVVVGVALWGVTSINGESESVAFSAKDQEKWATRITRHAREGNLEEAMRLLETSQAQQVLPEYDAKLLHSQLLIEYKQFEKAETILRGLIASYPQQPAAYNDLAIVLSRQGKQQEALDALNSAMGTHEAYQQIYSNIKSLSASLASTSYMKALNLGGEVPAIEMAYLLGNNRAVELQESAARWPVVQQPSEVLPTESGASTALAVAEPSTTVEPSETQTLLTALDEAKLEAPAAGSTTTDVVSQQVAAEPADTDQVQAPEKAEKTTTDAGQDVATFLKSLTVTTDPVTEQAMSTLTPPPALAVAEPADTPSLAQDEADVKTHVQEWAQAWTQKDVNGYLASYTDDYVSASHRSHQQWARERTARIKRAKEIEIALSDMVVEVATPNSARVTFTQAYRSRNYSDVTKKALSLVKNQQGWQIAEEVNL